MFPLHKNEPVYDVSLLHFARESETRDDGATGEEVTNSNEASQDAPDAPDTGSAAVREAEVVLPPDIEAFVCRF